MTRESGYKARAPGRDLEINAVPAYRLGAKESVSVLIDLPTGKRSQIVGFGGWFATSDRVEAELQCFERKFVVTRYPAPNWNKFGSQWFADGSPEPPARLVFRARESSTIAVWRIQAGIVEHEHLKRARPALMGNMHAFAPESNFILEDSPVDLSDLQGLPEAKNHPKIYLKSCNRCGRFLPINIANEREHLSYSNHCVATHRRPCSHSGFGRLRNVADDSIVQLEYGFQLECRFCKKFEVNAAHNPLRTAAQMKEDAARRRAFEDLLEYLYEDETPQLRFREKTGLELTDHIFDRFQRQCFKCATKLASPKDMHLDHTRPLAMLWPLDETATALCATCNSEKRDRAPRDFYSEAELRRLSRVTRIPPNQLKNPGPNRLAIQKLGKRLDWFYEEFLHRPELTETRDGKRAADLLIKALRKVLNQVPGGPPFELKLPKS